MNNANNVTRMPSHPGQPLDWKMKPDLQQANHGGANMGFTYMFPVSKYAEAFALGPTYISYYNYNHGNQPYNFRDYSGHTTPKIPSWLALQKVSPKGSASNIQEAQIQMGRLLASRTGIPYNGPGSL